MCVFVAATVTDNMPRGGTLVVVPTTLVRQWEIEIEKTLDTPEELNVHVWTDNRRIHDCNVLAKFDLVLTTPQMVAKTPTLPSIFWHRIIVDEAQLNAGSMMSRGTLFSTHRWIVTGTPCNASPESLGPSLDFLRLGGYDTAQRQLPPALATVLRAVMLRYTKNGTINGERNLELPPITERLVVCSLNENDAPQERALCRRIYNKEFLSHIRAGLRKGGHSTADADMPGFLSTSTKHMLGYCYFFIRLVSL